MKRYRIDSLISINVILLILSIINCKENPNIIDWPNDHNQEDMLLSPSNMTYTENARVEAYTPWGRVGSSIAACTGGVLVSEFAIDDGIGIGCFNWDGNLVWSALPGYSTRLSAQAITTDNYPIST